MHTNCCVESGGHAEPAAPVMLARGWSSRAAAAYHCALPPPPRRPCDPHVVYTGHFPVGAQPVFDSFLPTYSFLSTAAAKPMCTAVRRSSLHPAEDTSAGECINGLPSCYH